MSHCIAVTMAMVSGLLFGSLRFSIFAITSKQVHVSKLQTYLCVIQIQTVLSTDLMGRSLNYTGSHCVSVKNANTKNVVERPSLVVDLPEIRLTGSKWL